MKPANNCPISKYDIERGYVQGIIRLASEADVGITSLPSVVCVIGDEWFYLLQPDKNIESIKYRRYMDYKEEYIDEVPDEYIANHTQSEIVNTIFRTMCNMADDWNIHGKLCEYCASYLEENLRPGVFLLEKMPVEEYTFYRYDISGKAQVWFTKTKQGDVFSIRAEFVKPSLKWIRLYVFTETVNQISGFGKIVMDSHGLDGTTGVVRVRLEQLSEACDVCDEIAEFFSNAGKSQTT